MKRSRLASTIAMVAAIGLSATPALAHRAWLLPSTTIVSPDEAQVVTVDAAVSEDLFAFDHVPLRLDALTVLAPDGRAIEAQNIVNGKFRNSFDVPITAAGTYKVTLLNDGVFANWTEDGKPKRWRGSVEAFAKEVPANAEGLQVTQSQGRIESFFTSGAPSMQVFKPTGSGLEFVPAASPTDRVVGDSTTFAVLVDGKPAPGIKVSVIRGNNRYRNNLEEMTVTSGADGRVTIRWPQAGMYWLSASSSDDKAALKQAKQRRMSYVATIEVLTP